MSVHDAGADAARQSNKDYAGRLWQYKQAQTVGAMIYLGRKLGLFEMLAGSGPVSAAMLAEKSGLHERWLLEWLRLQTAAKVLDYVAPDQFELPAAGVELLGDAESGAYMLDNFDAGIDEAQIDGLIESFRTGIGRTYEEGGPEDVLKAERRHWRASRTQVLPKMIPQLEGVLAKLQAGCRVADVGCGDGALILTLAEAFPDSEFHASDPNRHSVARVKEVAFEMGLGNVSVEGGSGVDLPDHQYDLVMTFDCLHDMTNPQEVLNRIKACLDPQGTLFIKDIRSKAKFEDNLRNPMLAMMYGFSLMSCMSSAMSEPGGAGLGTLGFNPEVAEQMCSEAGFSHFTMHDFGDPGNLYYEVKP